MPTIKKIVGRAGTGKTTYMVKELEKLFNDGVKPWEIGMVTFSKVAARVFIKKSLEISNFNARDFKNFGTMHSIAAKLTGWKKEENEITNKKRENFIKEYYPEHLEAIFDYDEDVYRLTATDKKNITQSSKFHKMEDINGLLRSLCLIYNPNRYSLMEEMSGRDLGYSKYTAYEKGISEKYDKIELGWKRAKAIISPEEQDQFNKNYMEFKVKNDLIDYTDMLENVYNNDIIFNVKYLFVDEFQDFNRLQMRVYQLWRDNSDVERVCIAGDDAQTINRFAGGNSQYFISEPSDEHVVLPKTYRHGKVIFNDAKRYLDKMTNVIECDVLPSGEEGEIIQVYGDEWLNYLDFDLEESVLVLSATSDWVNITRAEIKERLPDVFFGTLGQKGIEERVLKQYNVIADLERGEEVEWERIKPLFASTNSIPSKMMVKETVTTLSGTTTKHTLKIVMQRIKSEIKSDRFANLETYNKKAFAEHFLTVKWNGKMILNHIKDISVFESAQDKFPALCTHVVNKHVGTIHKSKGDEADTVILFMSVAYPMQEKSHTLEGRDDILHLFYVGKTRPKTKLIEVYNYHGGNQMIAPAPFDLV